MDTVQETTSDHRKRNIILLASISVVLLGSGLIYMGQNSNWAEKTAAVRNTPAAGGPVKIAPAPASPALGAPTFDVVSADEGGTLVAAGKGPEGSIISLQNGMQILGQAKVDDNGEWVMMVEHLPPGKYNLSLLATTPEGKVSIAGARTLPLTVAPPKVASNTATEPGTVASNAQLGAKRPVQEAASVPNPTGVATVKHGDSLWKIARDHYKDGTRYFEIVQANKAQIRNPNLIYPDQQFAIPPAK
ncbi:MAG: LysM peptidoglycan-binding domain-containing protein [Rhodomicrobium sp.]